MRIYMSTDFLRGLFSTIVAAFLFAACGAEDPPTDPAPAADVKIIEPAGERTYRISDTVRIVVESDYSKFSSGIYVSISSDSAKTWDLIESRKKKQGIQKDTVIWTPGADNSALPGQNVLIKAWDYSDKHSDRSDYIHFTD